MCAVDPHVQYVISPIRVEEAITTFNMIKAKLTEDQLYDAICELGYGEALTRAPQGLGLKIALTELQFVAMSAGVQAAYESGLKVERRDEDTPASPIALEPPTVFVPQPEPDIFTVDTSVPQPQQAPSIPTSEVFAL